MPSGLATPPYRCRSTPRCRRTMSMRSPRASAPRSNGMSEAPSDVAREPDARGRFHALRDIVTGSGTLSLWAVTLSLRIGTTLVTLVNIVIIARLLGPTESGQYFVFVSVVLVLAVVAELGLSQSAIVFPSMYPEGLAQ